MNAQISWTLELEIQGGSDEFESLMKDMVRSTKTNEPGKLSYEWSRSAEGSVCHIYERYADSAAAMTHLRTSGERFAGRFLEILKPTRFVVFGSPSDGVEEALAGFNPRTYKVSESLVASETLLFRANLRARRIPKSRR